MSAVNNILETTPKSAKRKVIRFSPRPEFDDQLWKCLIDNIPTKLSMKQIFTNFMEAADLNSSRTYQPLYQRFRRFLAPQIPTKDFPIETKLALYSRYRLPVPETYLKVLQEHADFTIYCEKFIVEYKMKNTVKELEKNVFLVTPKRKISFSPRAITSETPRRKMRKMDPKYVQVPIAAVTPVKYGFISALGSPVSVDSPAETANLTWSSPEAPSTPSTSKFGKSFALFTPEEDQMMWTHFISHIGSEDSLEDVIEEYVQGAQKSRSVDVLRARFLNVLAPSLHLRDFSIEIKLKLYKRYRIPVDRKFLETLREKADVELVEGSYVVKEFSIRKRNSELMIRRMETTPTTRGTPIFPKEEPPPKWFASCWRNANFEEPPAKRTPVRVDTPGKSEEEPRTPKTWTISSPAVASLMKELAANGSPETRDPKRLKNHMMDLKNQINSMNMTELFGLKECIDAEIRNLADEE